MKNVGLFGVPPFTIALASAFLFAAFGLLYGGVQWNRRSGKIILLLSAMVLSLLLVVAMLVLLTVASGSMG